MLDHPWLKMEGDYEYKMTDKEYNDMMMKNQLKQQLKVPGDEVFEEDFPALALGTDMSQCIESNAELYNGDSEYDSDDSSFGNGIQYPPKRANGKMYESESDDDYDPQSPKINNSFTGPYTGIEKKIYQDKVPNPQFKAFMKKESPITNK
jgi:hypothetical protein